MAAAATSDVTIQFLFRYRDLVAETIKEHQAIIENEGSCWWGWWKRPSEDFRREVWDALRQRVKDQGGEWVGLFDSGNTSDNSVIKAYVTEVILPMTDEGGTQLKSPPVPKEQEKFIPSYYRRSPYSRAWMRISEIGSSFQFFGRYSYDVAPALPGIPAQYLSRLRGKVIIDSDELRTMDTTIWQVRSCKEDDHAEKFLVPAIRITEPISVEPIRTLGKQILPLTDLHFANNANSEIRSQHVWGYPANRERKTTLADAVGSALKNTKVGLLVISGDLTFLADDQEFTEALKSIRSLFGMLGLGSDHVVVVPGNHDILWTKDARQTYDPMQKIDNASEEARKRYSEFYEKLLGHSPNEDCSMGRRYVFPSGCIVDVCALNTSDLESRKNYLAGMGRTHPLAFGKVSQQLNWDTEFQSLALRLLVMHHHLTATEDVENPAEYSKGFGMAMDAKKTLREAARCGVHLVLYGHRHRAFFWWGSVYALPEEKETNWQLGCVSILGGGSAGSSDVVDNKNYFNLLNITSSEVIVRMF